MAYLRREGAAVFDPAELMRGNRTLLVNALRGHLGEFGVVGASTRSRSGTEKAS